MYRSTVREKWYRKRKDIFEMSNVKTSSSMVFKIFSFSVIHAEKRVWKMTREFKGKKQKMLVTTFYLVSWNYKCFQMSPNISIKQIEPKIIVIVVVVIKQVFLNPHFLKTDMFAYCYFKILNDLKSFLVW